MRELYLVGAVVVHHPDFFVPTAIADEENLAFSDARNPAAEAEDDFVCELVRDYAYGIVRRRITVLFTEYLRRSLIVQVIEPSLHGNLVGCDAKIAKREHGRLRRRRIPRRKGDVGRLARILQRIEALRNHFEDARVIEIVPESVVKSLQKLGVLGVGGR